MKIPNTNYDYDASTSHLVTCSHCLKNVREGTLSRIIS